MNPFIPIILLGFSFFGKSASTKAWINKTLTNVDGAVLLLKLFILAAAIILFITFGVWFVLSHRRRKYRQTCLKIVALLHRLRSDILLLNNESDMELILCQELEASRKEAVSLLKRYFMHKKFTRFQYFIKTLNIIANNKVSHQNQILLIDEFVKTIKN